MAISVDGYGNITQGNAKEIYVAWKRGEVDLNKAQQTKCESFLTPEDMDEVKYDTKSSEKTGKDAISTTDENGNSTIDSKKDASMAMGSIQAICAAVPGLCVLATITGFCSLAAAIVAAAASAVALGLAYAFDPSLSNRNDHSNNAANDNSTMDGYSDALGNTMEMMNEDVEHYNETQDQLTATVNTQVSQGADLQMQIDTAQAMGDTNKVQQLKEQLQALQETDNSGLEEELAATGEGLEEYRSLNAEALGCAESGQSVSDFLKDGNPLGDLAMANAIISTISVAAIAIATVVGAIPKIYPIPVDGPSAIASAILWTLAGALMGKTADKMKGKASQEHECGSNGEEMQNHVNTLKDLVSQQDAYTTDTEGQFAESDEGAAESKAGAEESAGEAVDGNKENLTNQPGKEEEKPAA